MTGPSGRLDDAPAERVLLGAIALSGQIVRGYVLDPERESESLVVELLLDGLPYQIARADEFDATLAGEGARNAFHGFVFVIPPTLFDTCAVAEIRLANDGVLIGPGLPLRGDGHPPAAGADVGFVEWLGGLRFGGWIAPDPTNAPMVRGLIDENQVVEAGSSGWSTIGPPDRPVAVPAFEFDLPLRFADGRAHRIEVISAAGLPLSPGPLTFVAFDDGLERFLANRSDVVSEQVRGALFDRLIPQSLPMTALDEWRQRFEREPSPASAATVAVVLIGDDQGLDATLASLHEQEVSWVAGAVPWRGNGAEVDPAELADFLVGDAAVCDVVVFALSGTIFAKDALQAMAGPLLAQGSGTSVYCDTIVALPNARRLPVGHPAFDLERMIEQGYAAYLFAVKQPAALAAARGGADSLFRLFDAAGGGRAQGPDALPLHIPRFLATLPPLPVERMVPSLLEAARLHCADHGIEARVEPVVSHRFPTVRLHRWPGRRLVSVVISVRNDAGALRRCLVALKAQTSVHELEFIVVDNDSSAPDAGALLEEIARDGVQIVRLRGPRNVARSANCGAAIAAGDYVCFVDQHVAVTGPEAIDELVSRCCDTETGAVGGCLVTAGGSIFDGGLVLNFREGATRAFEGCGVNDPAYADTLVAAREVSAVSGEFLLVPREAFLASGGLDEVVFPLFFASVDFSLRMRAQGQRVVFTPHAKAQWSGPTARNGADRELAMRFERELAQLRLAWASDLGNDLFYSPSLALNGPLHSALAWPPRDRQPRRSRPVAARRPPVHVVTSASRAGGA